MSGIFCRKPTVSPAMQFAWLAICASVIALGGCGHFSAAGKNAEGVRLFQQARYEEALKLFQEARFDDPADADAHYNIAATLHALALRDRRPEDFQQAEHSYRMCLDRNPQHRDAYRGLAVLLTHQGRTAEAFALLQGWVEQQPSSAEARIELARLCDEMGRKSDAENLVLQALALQPNNVRALTALGKLREESGRHAEALAAYQRSLALDDRQSELNVRIAALQNLLSPGAMPAGNGPIPSPTVPVDRPAVLMAGGSSTTALGAAGSSSGPVVQTPWR